MSRRILLADDSVTIQKVIELTFMDEDFEVRAVSNGDEAVALLSQSRPDFVIADVHMPGANGYEVCRRAKQELPGIPVLLLVGTFEPFDEGQARSAGADSFLKKPFDSQELLQRVQELLASSAPAPAVPATQAVMAVPEPAAPAVDDPFAFPAVDLTPAPAVEARDQAAAWSGFELEPEPAPAAPVATGIDDPFPFSQDRPLSLEPDDRSFAFQDERPFQIEDDSVLEVGEPRIGLRDESDDTPFAEPQDRFIADPQDRFLEDDTPAFPQASMGFGPMELTDQERLGVPLGQEPLVESLEETEERIAEERPRTFDVAAPHEPMSPGAGAGAFAPPLPMTAEDGGMSSSGRGLSDADVDRIARRVVELIGDKAVRDVAWEVVPDLAEVVIKNRLRELESQID